MTWNDAFAHVACLNTNTYLGYTNWRVPNVNELESLVNAQYGPLADWLALQGFSNVLCDLEEPPIFSWSSTSYAFDYTLAWYVDMCVGTVRPYDKGNSLVMSFSVWPETPSLLEASYGKLFTLRNSSFFYLKCAKNVTIEEVTLRW